MNPRLRVLLVDDDRDDRALAERLLSHAFEVEAVEVCDQQSFEQALRTPTFDAVVTDAQHRWTDGLALLGQIRLRLPHVPVVIFTGTGSEEFAVEAMRAGADDYVIKHPRHLFRLPIAVERALAHAREREARAATEEARRQAELRVLRNEKLQVLGRLAERIAHELVSTLSVVTGYTEMLSRKLPEDHPDHRRLQKIEEATGRAVELVRRLEALAGVPVGRPGPVDLASLPKDARKLLYPLLPPEVRLEADTPAGPIWVASDPTAVESAVVTIVLRLAETVGPGGRIAIGATELADGSGQLTVRCEPATASDRQDSGSIDGLDGVRDALSAFRGRLEALLERGERIYRITLPGASAAPRERASGPAPEGTGQVVLLVDDDPAFRELLKDGLGTLGYSVIDAGTATEALGRAADPGRAIDVLVSDVVLPDIDGWELAQRLCGIRPQLRVVLMSGYSMSGRAIPPETVPLLAKPFGPESLARAIQGVLRQPPPLAVSA